MAFQRSPHLLKAGRHTIGLGRQTVVMGILNCTPDSFSDGGRWTEAAALEARLTEMIQEGAGWIDVGGESSRPGALPVPAEEEWLRVAPALDAARRLAPEIPVSIDTTKPEVARRALEAGACAINDISGLRFAPELAGLAAAHGAALILMHMQGSPRDMQAAPHYDDVSAEVAAFLAGAAAEARQSGVGADQLVLDPGIGFGKSVEHNLEILRRLPELSDLGYPVMIGASRKSFLGRILDLPVDERVEASLAAHVAAVLGGAHLVRTHDVRATVRAVRIVDAVLTA